MALYIDPTIKKGPSLPDGHAHQANNQATFSADARSSKEALEKQISREREHPTQKKLLSISSQGALIYGGLAIAFFLILCWEWSVSREIYEVMISAAMPWVPFLGCVAIAFYSSVCIGEGMSRFSVLAADDTNSESGDNEQAEAIVEQMYDTSAKRKSKKNWLFHPITGSLMALLFLSGIYFISLRRVELLSAAGEMPDGSLHVWLPVILYGVEILLGIPTFFFAMWIFTWVRTRSQRKHYSQARMKELALCQSAVRAYTTYMREFEIFNRDARRNDKVEAYLVPPNTDLRKILEDSGYNLTSGDGGDSPPDDPADHRPVEGAAPRVDPPAQQVAVPHINMPHNGHDQNRREEDLLALLDEHISAQNRGL